MTATDDPLDYVVIIKDPTIRTVVDIEQSLQDLEYCFRIKKSKLIADYHKAKRELEKELATEHERIANEL